MLSYNVDFKGFLDNLQRAKETKSPVEWTKEENYMFEWSKFYDRIRRWLIDSGLLSESKSIKFSKARKCFQKLWRHLQICPASFNRFAKMCRYRCLATQVGYAGAFECQAIRRKRFVILKSVKNSYNVFRSTFGLMRSSAT